MDKPVLCIDFDGVLHSYDSGWQGADVVADGPVPGAMDFLDKAVECFDVCVYSSRSKSGSGLTSMRTALLAWLDDALGERRGTVVWDRIGFAHEKPAAFLTIDDRAICFDGTFPPVGDLLAFKPWNKR